MIFCQCGCLLDHCKNSLLQFVENISQQADAKVMFCLRERGNYKNSCPAQQIKTLSECIQNVETQWHEAWLYSTQSLHKLHVLLS